MTAPLPVVTKVKQDGNSDISDHGEISIIKSVDGKNKISCFSGIQKVIKEAESPLGFVSDFRMYLLNLFRSLRIGN